MIGSSDGKSYEDSVDHFLGNPIEDDFDAMRSGRKPAQEPAKKPSGDVSSEFPTTPFEKWWIQDYIGRDSARPKAIHGLDDRQNLEIDRLLKDMIPGPVDQQITPGEQIHDPQGQGRDVRVSDVIPMGAANDNNASPQGHIWHPLNPGGPGQINQPGTDALINQQWNDMVRKSRIPKLDILPGGRSDADERPVAGQQYAMEDKRIRTPPEGPGRPTSGGGSVERVDRPAIKIGDDLFEGKPGESHYHIMVNDGRLQRMPGKDMDRMESGWVTNTGRYVSREEAMSIAKKSEQIKVEPKRWKDDDFTTKELISEDFKGGRPPKEESGPMISNSDDGMKQFLDALSKFIPRRK